MRIPDGLRRMLRDYDRIGSVPLERLIDDFQKEIIEVYSLIEKTQNPIFSRALKYTLVNIITTLRFFSKPFKKFITQMTKEGIAAKLYNISKQNNKSGEIKW